MPKGVHGSKAPHGTRARYITHGCRCDECRAAHRTYEQKRTGRMALDYYLRLVTRPLEELHGTESGYKKGCRCEACREASARARRNRPARISGADARYCRERRRTQLAAAPVPHRSNP